MSLTRAEALALVRTHVSGIVAAVSIALLVVFGLLERPERWWLGELFRVRGPVAPRAPIVIVTIDEASFIELDTAWPFPRALHAQLVRRIAEGQPLAIGLDVILDTPSVRGPDDDEALGAAVEAAGNVVLAMAPRVEAQPSVGVERTMLNEPIRVIRRGAAAVAPINMLLEDDGAVRRVPIRWRVAGAPVLGFDARLHELAAARGLPVASLPAASDVLINFRGGPRTYPWVPYYRVIHGETPPEVFRDKIVLIGPTSPVFHDVFPTVFARDMPGVEVHANALETLIMGVPVRELPAGLGTAIVMAAALVGCALVVRLHALRALLAAVLLWLALTGFAYVGFVYADLWMPAVAATGGLVLGYGVTVLQHFVREQRERRQLSQFFSPEVLREVVRRRADDHLGSRRRLITVLFSDLRGFTSMSEALEPEQVAEILRDYLTEMTEIVFRHHGTVDKYIGDCLMALYNAPLEDPEHVIKAVRTALELQARTVAFSQKWHERLGVVMRCGVGINTGDAVVGTMGSRQRLEYTAIGDTVNLAARLESLTKEYGAPIIISESSRRQLPGEFLARELGEVTVRGKTRPVRIYAVLAGDERRHARTVLRAPIPVSVVAEGGSGPALVTDISAGGLGLTSRGVGRGWEPGAPVQIRASGDPWPEPRIAEGTIAWRRGPRAGVAFGKRAVDAAPLVAELQAGRVAAPSAVC